MFTVRFTLPADAAEALARPVVGQGGFQSLLRQLQGLLADGEPTLTPASIGKMVRYVQDYGQGGFQGRLDTVLEELKKLGDVSGAGCATAASTPGGAASAASA